MNDFIPKMLNDVFGRLRPRYQIPDDIPLRMAKKGEKCYSGRIASVGFYEFAFIVGLRLPFTKLHWQLADYLGVFVCQIAPILGGYSLG